MFVPFCSELAAPGKAPTKWMLLMHGIYGRGGNWRTFARKICEVKPEWGLLLTDLRMHGQSMSAAAPHSVNHCAQDVLSLIDTQSGKGHQVEAVLGHSFGGKVALEMRRLRPAIEQVWLIDSSPSSRPDAMEDPENSVVAVLRMLGALPESFPNREDFVAHVAAAGFAKNLALWLAMNLERSGDVFRLSLQPWAMEALLRDYFARDLWDVVEHNGHGIHVVQASRGSALSEADARRLELLGDRGVDFHKVEGSHWLHVDGLDELVSVVAGSLL